MSQVKQKESKYKKQIKQFHSEESRIDAQIDKLIRDAIAASNKKAGGSESTATSSTSKATFTLTAEAKELASKFTSNKGSLPWPVEKGYVSTYYGKQPHPVVKTVMIQSNGVRIATEENAPIRAVFNGKVLAVQAIKHGNLSVLIQHGNYVTVYKNLSKVYVKKGDNVTTKQEIGQVFTNPSNKETILSFSIFKESATQNPAEWIYKM